MCGIFGVVAAESSLFTGRSLEDTFSRLFKLSESRGKEAAGFARISPEEIRVCKGAVSATEFMHTHEYRDLFDDPDSSFEKGPFGTSRAIIGHSRLVTTGNRIFHQNNQPVVNSGVIGVHNGIIVNDEQLWRHHAELSRRSDVDSEVLAALLRMFYSRHESLPRAAGDTFAVIEGSASIAFQFEDLDQLLLATNNGSLYLCADEGDNSVIFGSESYILQQTLKHSHARRVMKNPVVRQLKPGWGCLIGLRDASLTEFRLAGALREQPETIRLSPTREINDLSPVHNQGWDPVSSYSATPVKLRKEFQDAYERSREAASHLRRCTRCILPETMPGISFDEKGVCSICRSYTYQPVAGLEALEKILAPHRKSGGRSDCLCMLSGGRDSSYGLHLAKKVLGLNPVTFTYDWGMVTDLARRNISRMCSKLGVENILVSADIGTKRKHITANLKAWLKKPDLGMVPLLMAGDKHFFYYANQVRKQHDIDTVFYCTNRRLEKTLFKSGFCGVPESGSDPGTYYVGVSQKMKLVKYYLLEILRNPAYLNRSVFDTLFGFWSAYFHTHNMVRIFEYVLWDEKTIEDTLINEYGWEVDRSTSTTWRIGDGTAAFYNYIYFTAAGFSENDTMVSNMIREKILPRQDALKIAAERNLPRFEAMKWYCDIIAIDFEQTIRTVNSMARLYPLRTEA